MAVPGNWHHDTPTLRPQRSCRLQSRASYAFDTKYIKKKDTNLKYTNKRCAEAGLTVRLIRAPGLETAVLRTSSSTRHLDNDNLTSSQNERKGRYTNPYCRNQIIRYPSLSLVRALPLSVATVGRHDEREECICRTSRLWDSPKSR